MHCIYPLEIWEFFTWQYISEIYVCCWYILIVHYFLLLSRIPLYRWTIINSFTRWKAFELFPGFGGDEESCKYSHTVFSGIWVISLDKYLWPRINVFTRHKKLLNCLLSDYTLHSTIYIEKWESVSCPVVSNTLRLHGL